MTAPACCPHCGNSEEFFVHLSMRGTTEYNRRFDGDSGDNTEMHDALNYIEGKWCYCKKCRKRVGKNPNAA
jgi:hypothetical protein